MTELQLYKFITENDIEHHPYEDGVYVFIHSFETDDFISLIGSGVLKEDGVPCHLKNGYFVVNIKDVCEYHGIEMSEVFDLDKDK